MAGCATCFHKNVHPNVCSDCLCGTHFKPRIKTNADRIRAMTDKELAEWLSDMHDDVTCPDGGAIDCNPSCKRCWLDWLKEEAEDG